MPDDNSFDIDGDEVYETEWYSVIDTGDAVYVYHKEEDEYSGFYEDGMSSYIR